MRIRIFEKTSDIDQLSNSFSKKCIISYQEFQIFKVLLPKGLLVTELHIQFNELSIHFLIAYKLLWAGPVRFWKNSLVQTMTMDKPVCKRKFSFLKLKFYCHKIQTDDLSEEKDSYILSGIR